jgi:hypothetical protein
MKKVRKQESACRSLNAESKVKTQKPEVAADLWAWMEETLDGAGRARLNQRFRSRLGS